MSDGDDSVGSKGSNHRPPVKKRLGAGQRGRSTKKVSVKSPKRTLCTKAAAKNNSSMSTDDPPPKADVYLIGYITDRSVQHSININGRWSRDKGAEAPKDQSFQYYMTSSYNGSTLLIFTGTFDLAGKKYNDDFNLCLQDIGDETSTKLRGKGKNKYGCYDILGEVENAVSGVGESKLWMERTYNHAEEITQEMIESGVGCNSEDEGKGGSGNVNLREFTGEILTGDFESRAEVKAEKELL